jgi:hypothetical protein
VAKFRIQRPKFSLALAHGASATTKTASATINGILREVIIKTPASVDNTATMTLNIIDSDNFVVYTKSGVAANTNSINLLTNDQRVPLAGTQTIQIVFSAAQDTTDTTTMVVLLVEAA